ncbi:Lactonase, 7-bladed beta-propeller-domain-containing protein [Nemania serpens]|nr:Lactonase, 7-bladed beta-propeller-domain-containing protein [Nemania serpens]
MLRTLTTLITLGSMATAAPSSAMPRAAETHNLIIGGPGQIAIATFDGSAFTITGQHLQSGRVPSWMRYKHSTNALYANNENADDIDVFDLKSSGPTPTGSVNGSSGVVFLEFNKDQTRMVGAGYASENLDVWDTSAAGAPKLIKTVKITGPLGPKQSAHHPHQAILDPTGRFMVVPDLGGDQLLVLRLQDDKFDITNAVTLFPGAGPRHGSFIGGAGKTFFLVACETSNLVVLYEIGYNDAQGITFKWISEQPTWGNGTPKNVTTAAAGAILVSADQKHVYISNRLTGDDEDNIAHFAFAADTQVLTFRDRFTTTGVQPRSMAFSANAEQDMLFVANQGGKNGLVAFKRYAADGRLSVNPVGVMEYAKLVAKGYETSANVGPQFVTAYLA